MERSFLVALLPVVVVVDQLLQHLISFSLNFCVQEVVGEGADYGRDSIVAS